MKLSYEIILKKLESFDPEILISSAKEININDIEIYRSFYRRYSSDTLYIIRPEEIKYIKNAENSTNISNILEFPRLAICTGQPSPADIRALKNISGANNEGIIFMAYLMNENVPYTDIYDMLYSICAGDGTCDEAETAKERILDALYEEKELEEILDVSARYMKNPVKIYNAAGILVMISPYGSECLDIYYGNDAGQQKYDIEMENIGSYMLNTLINIDEGYYISENEYDKSKTGIKKRLKSIGKRYTKPAGSAYFPVRIKNMLIGFMSVEGIYRPVRKKDTEKLKYAAKIVSMKMQYDIGECAVDIDKMLIKSIVNNTYNDNKLLKMQHENVEKTFGKGGMRAMIVRAQDGAGIYAGRAVIKQIMQSFFDNCITLFFDKNIMILINQPAFRKLESEAFKSFLERNRLNAGVSCMFDKLTDIQQFYIQADSACVRGAQLEKHKRVHMYDELYIYDMLQIYSNEYDIKSICHSAVKILADRGTDTDIDLLRTLYEYLRCACDTAKAAERLNIHRNTMYYRMEQIKKLTGADIDDGRERFLIMLSFYDLNMAAGLYDDEHWKKASEAVFTENME